MLSCENISLVDIQGQVIFRDINITLPAGSMAIIRGKNGAGKTSLLRIIAGIQVPTKGKIYLDNILINDIDKPCITYLGHQLGIRLELTVEENLTMWAKFYNSEITIAASINYFGLQELLQIYAYRLSAGMRKKLALARLMACNSNIWLLDEVETNLDQDNLQLLYNAVNTKINSGGIVIWASHSLAKFNKMPEINLEDFL